MTIREILEEQVAVRQRMWQRADDAGESEDTLDTLWLSVLDARLALLRWIADQQNETSRQPAVPPQQ